MLDHGGSVPHRTLLAAGSAHPTLARSLAAHSGIDTVATRTDSFPDGELHVAVDPHVAGAHVCVLQPTGPPAERSLLELLLLIDACRRSGAAAITAVVPYLGYARQDRATSLGDAIGLRVVADTIAGVRPDRLVVVDPHGAALEAVSNVPVTIVSAVPALASALASRIAGPATVVAPDLGAVKLAERYAEQLDLPVAVVRKIRTSGAHVSTRGMVGDVADRTAIIVDDMISTGATVAAAVQEALAAGAREEVLVAATHAVLAGPAREVLSRLPVRRLVLGDTLAFDRDRLPRVQVVGTARPLAVAIRRLAQHPAAVDVAATDAGLSRHV